ncbi:MAG: hypothetical protein JST67_06310 [Bacteroidetes bacterium]|nr:hypothetical protein [Bacteroidota bacterium]
MILFFVCGVLNISAQDAVSKKDKKNKNTDSTDNPPALGSFLKPTIGIGVGTLSYFGNIYAPGHRLQALAQSRFGYELNLSQPITNYLHFNFYVLFGKLGANERSYIPSQNQNFESQIRMGGIQLLYDFSNFIKNPKCKVRPYILTGFEGFEFLSKTDMYDAHGNKYYYWNDGTIRNMAQGSPNSQNAQLLTRDYTYDTDIRQLNQNGYGRYSENSWAIPVGLGFTMKAGEHITFRMGATMHFAFTNHIDGVGSTINDKFLGFTASAHYDLYSKRKPKFAGDTLPKSHYDNVDFLALDNGDEDGDGVKDFDDLCHGTPAGAKVDKNGCPVDDDKDNIPEYRDEEPASAKDAMVNGKGITMNDADFQDWYDRYYDSTGIGAKTVDITSKKTPEEVLAKAENKKMFTVELARYKNGIPSDEMAYLLSIEDVHSLTMGDTTVVYTSGSYKNVQDAVTRRDNYRKEGLKSARVGILQGGNTYIPMNEDELSKEITAAKASGMPSENNNTPTDNTANTTTANGKIIYRIQLGAYKNKLSPSVFKNAGKVVEMKTEDGYYKYASGSFSSIAEAAGHKAELVYEGYEDAFIAAYQNGKRVPLDKAGATYADKNYHENLNESANTGSAIDKSLVKFKVQVAFVKAGDTSYDDMLKDLQEVERQPTITGRVRIVSGNFSKYKEAEAYKDKLVAKGLSGAFVVAFFKGENISLQEAFELIKP